jgi:signal transduction histidine kinase
LETGEAVAAMAFDGDGIRLALAGTNGIAVWDFAARRVLHSLQLENGAEVVTDLTWHPSGSLLAAAHADGSITLLNARSGARQTIKAHTMVITRVLFDPRGDVLVSTSWDGTTRFWDARSGRPLLTTQTDYALGFDAAGQRLFYFKERLGVGAWDYQAATGFARLVVPIGISDRILGVDFSPDGQWLAGTTKDGVHLWNRETHEHAAFLSLTNTERAAFMADSRSLVVSTLQGFYGTHLANAVAGGAALAEPKVLPGTEGRGFWLGFITQGERRWFAAASPTRVAAVNLGAASSLKQYLWSGPRRSATISPGGRYVAVSAWKGGGTHVWDTQLGRRIASLGDEGGLAWFSPDGQRLAVGASTEFLFYDTATWQCATRLKRDVVSALSGILAYSADGQRIALTHGVRQVQLLDSGGMTVLASLNAPHPERITALSFSQDGQLLAASTDNREIQLWDFKQLQRELADAGLNWEGPPRRATSSASQAATPAAVPAQPTHTVWLSALGVCGAGLFAAYSLRHHQRLIAAYATVEAEAMENQRHLKAAQGQLRHNEKMQALGTLAAGIAHDFNNLLSVIRMAGQLVQRELKPTGCAKQNLEDIEQAAVQGKDIVRSILGYSRQPGDPNLPYSVNAVVGETLTMLSKQFLSGIVLMLELAPDAPAASGDKSRLEQVLLNLIVNASEAMGGKGKLKLSVRPRFDGRARILTPRPAAEYVELIVQDFGPGISQEILPRIFEPFFSTKQSGQQHGPGLGLTTVYNIAQQDGLGLDVETAVGQGTSFRVLLPVGSPPAPKA